MTDTWTPERIDTLKSLWNKGISITQIGKRMGMSRNSVVGKAHRLNLARRSQSPNLAQRPAKPRPPAPAVEWTGCRWPMWGHKDAPDTPGYGTICGADIERGSYCAHHRTIAYRKSAEAGDEAEAA